MTIYDSKRQALEKQDRGLFRNMLKHGYDKDTITRLTLFTKHYVRFDKPEMNRKFDEVVSEITQSHEPMGIIEALIHETKQEAFKEGLEEGMEKGMEKLLLKGFSVGKVSKMLDMPKEVAEKILDRLQEVAEKILDRLRKEGKMK